MRFISFIAIAILIVSCAATYKQPTLVAPQISASVSASKEKIMAAAKKVLVLEGFQITSIDDDAGIISTAPKNLHVTPAQADCGTTMGLDYLKDKRTTTRVAFGVIAEDGRVTVKASIEGEYKPGAVDQNITLTCISRGNIERDMLSKIVSGLK